MIYSIQLIKNYPIINTDGQLYFIDLGQPESIARDGQFQFMGRTISCKKRLQNRTTESVSSDLGVEIHAMIGVDVLSQYYLRFDYANLEVEVSQTAFPTNNYTPLPFVCNQGIFVTGRIEGIEGRLLIDSGFKAIYTTNPAVVEGKTIIGHIDDTDMRGNVFHSSIYSVNVQIANLQFNANVALFENDLPFFRDNLHILGAVGYDFFAQTEIVMDFHNNSFFIKNR